MIARLKYKEEKGPFTNLPPQITDTNRRITYLIIWGSRVLNSKNEDGRIVVSSSSQSSLLVRWRFSGKCSFSASSVRLPRSLPHTFPTKYRHNHSQLLHITHHLIQTNGLSSSFFLQNDTNLCLLRVYNVYMLSCLPKTSPSIQCTHAMGFQRPRCSNHQSSRRKRVHRVKHHP